MEDKRFSNDELAKIVEGLDVSNIDPLDVSNIGPEFIHINLCYLGCRYAESCPEMAGQVIAVDEANLQVPYAEIRKKLIAK
ncbi:MAG: hypothetical protein WC852_02790 [Candidatus Nanoarchaeia archaeon]|jgi:hypothetical protein